MDDLSKDPNALAIKIAQDAGLGPVANARFLTGGVSAQIVAFEAENRALVARLYGPKDFASNPKIAELEYAILQLTGAHGVPVAEPLWVIQAGVVGPRSGLLTTLIDGTVDERPADQSETAVNLAEVLRLIHRVPLSPELIRQLPAARFHPERWSQEWRELGISNQGMEQLKGYAANFQSAHSVLLHGDFWPGNVLWKNGIITGVIDWEDARFGDPRFDLGGAFLELVLATSLETGLAFLDAYLAGDGEQGRDLSFFVLDVALRLEPNIPRFGFTKQEEAHMRKQITHLIAFVQEHEIRARRSPCPLTEA